jgi:hypothetical protein
VSALDREWISYREAAEILGIKRSSVSPLVRRARMAVRAVSATRVEVLRSDVVDYARVRDGGHAALLRVREAVANYDAGRCSAELALDKIREASR